MDIRGRAVGTEQVAGAGPAENTGHADNAGLAEDARLAETAGRVAGVEAPLSTGHAQGSSGGSGRWPAFAIGRVRRATWVRVAVITPLFAFVLLAVPVILSLYFVDAMTQVVVYSIVALGLGVLVGRVGLYSLGQAAVLAIGAWTAARFLFATSLPYPVVLLAAGAITMVLGTVILLPALRLRGLYLALITLMLAGAITVALNTLNFPNGGHGFLGYNANLIHIPPIRRPSIAGSDPAYYRYAVVVATLMFLLVLWHVRTRPGRAWVAIRQSEPAAPAAGINTTLYKIWAWALASFVTGVAGGLLAGGDHYLYSIDFPTQESITLLAVVLMAGAYSLWGAIVAGLLLQLLPSLFQNWGVSSDWITILFGIGVLQVLTTAPRGLADQVPKDLRRLGRLLGGLARRATVSRARAS
jgi:branched-chain amino acid transport system permease protein